MIDKYILTSAGCYTMQYTSTIKQVRVKLKFIFLVQWDETVMLHKANENENTREKKSNGKKKIHKTDTQMYVSLKELVGMGKCV